MELQAIQNKIYEIRGQKVMLDFDLAEMYGTETAQLKRAVRRNIERFPDDFMFTLTIQEFNNLKNNMVCQIGISKKGGNQYAPFAFTEQGIAMLSSVLRSGTSHRNHRKTKEFIFLIISYLHISYFLHFCPILPVFCYSVHF